MRKITAGNSIQAEIIHKILHGNIVQSGGITVVCPVYDTDLLNSAGAVAENEYSAEIESMPDKERQGFIDSMVFSNVFSLVNRGIIREQNIGLNVYRYSINQE